MTRDWMSRTHLDDLSDEARTVRNTTTPTHHPACTCRDCAHDEITPGDAA